jgi:hypothetical protein
MNKKKFIGLIFMMLFSIVGIIWVQIIWISNAVGVLNENFNARVIASINDAAKAIESSRKMNFFNDFILKDPYSYNKQSGNVSGYFNIESFNMENGGNLSVRITNQSVTQKPGEKPVIITHDTTITSDSVTLFMTSPDEPGKMKIVRKGKEAGNNEGEIYIRQKEFIDWVRKSKGRYL